MARIPVETAGNVSQIRFVGLPLGGAGSRDKAGSPESSNLKHGAMKSYLGLLVIVCLMDASGPFRRNRHRVFKARGRTTMPA